MAPKARKKAQKVVEKPAEVIKPADQLQLGPKELEEEITRMLRSDNPQAPDNTILFNFNEQHFVASTNTDKNIHHFSQDTILIGQSGAEAEQEEEYLAMKAGDKETKQDDAADDVSEAPEGDTVLRNRFNFSERATQCFTYPYKDKNVTTEAPRIIEVRGTVDQSVIYDAYMADARRKEAAPAASADTASTDVTVLPSTEPHGTKAELGTEALGPLHLMERMISQNTLSSVIADYKFFENPADAKDRSRGSMLPLWKFKYDRASSKAVTDVAWHPEHPDLFAVAYGTRAFLLEGAHPQSFIAVFSLTRPHYPEAVIVTPANICSVAWNPIAPSQLAAGLYSGEIAVYDIARAPALPTDTPTQPLARSTARNGKHLEAAWAVTFWADSVGRGMDIYSTSTDGTAACWTVAKTDIKRASQLSLHDGGMVLAFNPGSDHHYLVGTSSGTILLCSKAYTTHYLREFKGHTLPVSGLSWNRWMPDLFLSAAEDWAVVLWDSKRDAPIARFELDVPVHSVAWSPATSTVFAIARADGKIAVYDLAINRYRPVCQHTVCPHRVTTIAFSDTTPVILAGDEKGVTHVLKLSPNLRQKAVFVPPKPKPGQPPVKISPEEIARRSEAMEKEKLEDFVKFAIKSNIAAGMETN
ncbi:WD domain, G-beta repeat [Carpediemonas membranifera]|uniref:WD domain, G-beta repeat n=1 Tax=Carpediemonas membranifera TaxID=201153 RepID=A0A8J6BXY1_9EUKA|nr:WD domain, G-beta repeat [Carpediemonas membranifera]|eukprot:KAG9393936.1 WD domain, G-beta repeat [Carpediemonas membranifera]